MESNIQLVYKSYVDLFNNYDIQDSSLKKDVKEWIEEFKCLAESSSNLEEFYNSYLGSDLEAKQSNLITKVHMIANNLIDNDSKPVDDDINTDVITVKDFLEQYRLSYNEISKTNYRTKIKKTYENIFNIANETDDMIEAQIILEEKELLWKIIAEDGIEIFENIYEAINPLDDEIAANIQLNLEAYEKSNTSEELYYKLDFIPHTLTELISHYNIKRTLLTQLLLNIVSYSKVKVEIWYNVDNEGAVKKSMEKLIILRKNIKNILNTLNDDFNLKIEDIYNNESLKIFFLSPLKNIDIFGKIKTVSNPQNYDAIYEIITEEIIPNISLSKILSKEPKTLMFYYQLDSKEAEKFDEIAKNKANEITSRLNYYKFMNEFDVLSKEKSVNY